MFENFYSLIWDICKYDWKYLIRYFQKYGVSTVGLESRNALTEYFKDGSVFYSLTPKLQETIISELGFYRNKMVNKYKGSRNYTRARLQKKLMDYNIEIQRLKNLSFDFRKKINILDSKNDSVIYQRYTQEWADVLEKIKFLSSEVSKFKKELE